MSKFKSILIFNLCMNLIATMYGMENQPDLDQKNYNAYCAKTLCDVYQAMNANNQFSVTPSTESKYWETKTILGKPFFCKKPNVLLSDAIKDLHTPDSKTQFECSTAMCVGIWKVLESKNVDNFIAKLEQRYKDFFFPLIQLSVLSTLEQYANYYGFAKRDVKFDSGPHTVNTKEEWGKITSFKSCLDKLEPLLYQNEEVEQQEGSLPYETVLGGGLYLPNVDGVTGPEKGENLVCVTEGLYYGFGSLFKDGPKTLVEIGRALATSANIQKNDETFYGRTIIAYLKKNEITAKEGVHRLQYLIIKKACRYFKVPQKL